MMKFKQFFQENMVRSSSRTVWEYRLEKKGWKPIGRGANALVFGHPSKKYVLKVYEGDDYGYKTFLDFLETQQGNPDVVMMKRRLYQRPDGVDDNSAEVVALEKLKPLTKDNILFNVIYDVSQYIPGKDLFNLPFEEAMEKISKNIIGEYEDEFNYAKEFGPPNRALDYKRRIQAFNILIKRYNSLFRTLFELKRFARKQGEIGILDLHKGNFMIRPSTGKIVITDPLC
jgi:hypothetical protein